LKDLFFYFKLFLCIFLFLVLTVPLWAPYAVEALLGSSFAREAEEIFPESNYTQRPEVKEEPEGYKMKVVSTAYYKPEENQRVYAEGNYRAEVRMNGNGITYTETVAKIGTIAADPKVIPLGSVIYVPGYGRGIVEDIGSAIKGKRIDLFMGEGEKALKRSLIWGKKEVEITILEWGEN